MCRTPTHDVKLGVSHTIPEHACPQLGKSFAPEGTENIGLTSRQHGSNPDLTKQKDML